MPDCAKDRRFDGKNQQLGPAEGNSAGDEDVIMEEILKNINNTPVGQVLKKIASLPEVRKKKILDLRQQLTEGKYDLNKRLNIALDKVLEDLTAQ